MNRINEIVFKIGFTLPQLDDTWSNRQKIKWEKDRKYYTCNVEKGNLNIVKYIADEDKILLPSKDLLRVYAGWKLGMDFLRNRLPTEDEAQKIDDYLENFNSLGIFDFNGTLTIAEYNEWITGVQQTASNIWHGVISLPIWLSLYVGYEDMVFVIDEFFKNFLVDMRLNENNVKLFCGIHINTEHTHLHFAFYEKKPLHIDKYGNIRYMKKGKSPTSAIEKLRNTLNNYFNENLRYLSNYHNAIRRKFPTYVPTKKDLYIALLEMDSILPKDKYLYYSGVNVATYRKDIDMFAVKFIRAGSLIESYRKVLRSIAKQCNSFVDRGKKHCLQKLNEIYKTKLGNVMLGMINQFRNDPTILKWNRPKNSRQFKAQARCRRVVGNLLVESTIKVLENGLIQSNIMHCV